MPLRRLVVAALVLCLAGMAEAQSPATPANLKKAKAHFLQAEAFKDAAAYEQAIEEYKAAYALAPLPDFLFNIGQVYRLMKDKKRALDYYTQYLDANPDGRVSQDARGFIATLTVELKAEAAAAQPEKTSQPIPSPRVHRDTGLATDSPLKAAPPPDAPPSSHRGRGLRIAGLVTMGVGVGAVIGGLAFGLAAKSKRDAASSRTSAWDPSIERDGKAAQTNMYLLVGVGSAALVGGGIMWYLGHRAGNESVTVGPVVTPNSAGLAVGGRL